MDWGADKGVLRELGSSDLQRGVAMPGRSERRQAVAGGELSKVELRAWARDHVWTTGKDADGSEKSRREDTEAARANCRRLELAGSGNM